MSTLTARPNGSGKRRKKVETAVSAFDILNAALIACIMLVGFLVTVLFLIWFTTAFDFSSKKSVQLLPAEPFGDEKPEGYEDDVLEPGVEEFPEVETPQLMDALEAVTDAVSSVKANIEKRDGDAAQMGRGRGLGSRDGGDGTGNANVVPEWKRWVIEYESKNPSIYAQQIDGLGIILGAVHKENTDIMLVSDISRGGRVSASDRKQMGKTLRFGHKKPRMKRWDENFCSQAGVDMQGRLTCQFYNDQVRAMIWAVEQAHFSAAGKEIKDVRRTYLKVVKNGSDYGFVVTDMLFFN